MFRVAVDMEKMPLCLTLSCVFMLASAELADGLLTQHV